MPSQPWMDELRRHWRTLAIQFLVPLFIALVMRLLNMGPWGPQFAPGDTPDSSAPPDVAAEALPFAEL